VHSAPSGAAPVRVLRIVTRTNVGGPSLHVALLTAGLGAGHDTLLVAGPAGPDEAEASEVLARHDVRPVRVTGLVRRVAPLRDLRALQSLRSLIRTWRPHVVHTHTAKAGALGRMAAVREGVPRVVHTFHGHVFRGHLGGAGTALALAAERRLAGRSDALVAVSPEIAADLVERYRIAPADRVHVVPLGVPVPDLDAAEARARARAALGLGPDVPVALLAGRLVAVKRPLHALAAFARARERVPGARLLIAGGGPLEGAVRAAAGRGVHVLGWRTDVPELVAASDALLLASAMEGSPVALIEGAHLGRPAAATRVGGVPSVVVDGVTGLLADPDDPGALGDALARLLSDAALRARLGDAARVRARERFDVDRMLAAHRDLYACLLGD